MKNLKSIDQNANSYSIKGLIYTLVLIGVIWILTFTGIFTVSLKVMTLSVIAGGICLIIPLIICKIAGISHWFIKYLIMFFLCAAMCSISAGLTYHAVYAFVMPLLFANQYRERKFLIYTYIMVLISLITSTFVGYYYGICDMNILFTSQNTIEYYINQLTGQLTNIVINEDPTFDLALHVILPRALILSVFALISKNIVDKNSYYEENSHALALSLETDNFTRFFNKEKFDKMMKTYYPEVSSIGILFWDINNLKVVNDTFGHLQGDFVISNTADIIFSCCDNNIKAYRIGGDEFVAIVEKPRKGQLEEISADVSKKIDAFNETSKVEISVACGYAYGLGKNCYDIFKKADSNMYEIKNEIKEREGIRRESVTNVLEDSLFEAYASSSEHVYFFINDLSVDITRVSDRMVDYFDLPDNTIKNFGDVWKAKIHRDDKDTYDKDINRLFSGETRTHKLEYRAINKDGEYVWLECRGSIVYDKIRNVNLFAGFLIRIDNESKYDPLTKMKTINEAVKFDYINNYGVVLELDIDDFRKTINVFGYSYGNYVLCEFANILMTYCSGRYDCFRLEGDQFLIIAYNASKTDAEKIWHDISSIAKDMVDDSGRNINMRLTGGALMFPENGSSNKEIFTNLEHTIDYGKSHAKGKLTFYSDDITKQHRDRINMRQDVLASVKYNRNDFEMFFQPVYSAKDEKTILSCEALIRHKKWDEKFINVGDAIKILEHSGDIDHLGRWILNEVFVKAKKWQKMYKNFSMSVNVSMLQFKDISLVDYIIHIANIYKIDPSRINLELTESFDITDYEKTGIMINKLRDFGFKISLDDFGIEYSTLLVIKELPADYIKIDQFFVKTLTESGGGSSEAIIEAIIWLGKKMNLKVIAEGVENEKILKTLRKYDIYLYQGYHFSKPLPVNEFEKELEKNALK